MGSAAGGGAGHVTGVGGWSWEEKKEADLRIGAALARRMSDDPCAFDRDREPREGDLAVYRGRVVEVLSLGLPGDEVRRMFRDGELCPFVRLEDTDPPDGERRPLSEKAS